MGEGAQSAPANGLPGVSGLGAAARASGAAARGSRPRKHRLPVRIVNASARVAARVGYRLAKFAESEEWFLDKARRAAGYSDFGDGRFRQHLRVLLRAYDEEARLTPFGRMMVRGELLAILKNRLAVQQAWQRAPQVLEAEIRRPVFILGLPRTGTTALHHLLAQDPANQVLEYWLAAAPGPRPPRVGWERDPRYKSAVRSLRLMYYLDPSLEAIHWMTADGPDECRHLFLQEFLDDTFDSNATIPSYTQWFAQQDMRPSYARHRDILKLIQSTDPSRRWILKYPAHLRHLRILLETYPDACIVQTHRDPARVLPSICSLVSGWRSLYEDGVDRKAVGRWQLEVWAATMERAMAVRQASDPHQFFDIWFQETVSDPVSAIRRMYSHFGFELSREAEERMRAWHEQNPQGKHGLHAYTAEEFGLTYAEIAARFEAYSQHFQVEPEPLR